MQISRVWSTDPQHSPTDPFPPDGKHFYFALTKGDVLEPLALGSNWFSPPYPKRVLRFNSRLPLPFFSWRFGSLMGYAGFKVYGVDAPAYKEWLCDPVDVYAGSLAMCVTIRNGLTVLVPLAVALLAGWLWN